MAPMTRMIRCGTWFVTALLGLAVSAGAQQIATEQNRREALQLYRVGQEFLSGEQKKPPNSSRSRCRRTGS